MVAPRHFIYESRKDELLPRARFARRLAAHALLAAGLLALSLAAGIAGYMHFENLSMLDAFLNSAMLLGGMGPVGELRSTAAKLFAGCYALYAGLVFIASITIILTPVVHRIAHRFHVDH